MLSSSAKSTAGRVVAAGGVVGERKSTRGRVVVAGGVVRERNTTDGRVGGRSLIPLEALNKFLNGWLNRFRDHRSSVS